MADEELSPIERLKQEMKDSKKGSNEETARKPKKKRKVKVKTTAKKGAAKPVKVAKKGKKAVAEKKPAKAAKKPVKAAKKPAKKAASGSKPAKATGGIVRKFVRDRNGDGLTPTERKIIKVIADAEEPVSVVTIARRMYGEDCPSEGPDSYRTVRNGLRFPVRYEMVNAVKGSRGLYEVGKYYKRVKGDLSKLAERYRSRAEKDRKAS